MTNCDFSPYNSPVASFRDPAGRLVSVDGRIIRIISKSYVSDVNAILASTTVQRFAGVGRFVRTDVLDGSEAEGLLEETKVMGLFDRTDVGMVVEHNRLWFPAFPYEWPPEMLYEAGCLSLDLAEGLLTEGFGLKDATPYNILFRGPEPVFVDLLSLERRDPGDPTWLPYAQFVRTFLLPLLANKHFDIPLDQLLIARRDGLKPEEVYRLCGTLQKLVPPFLTLVSMPTWLAARHNQDDPTIYRKKSLDNPEKASFILGALFKTLRRMLNKLAPKDGKKSAWSDYNIASKNNYSHDQIRMKEAFIISVMADFTPKKVLDVGCNTGHFSAIAANGGASVIAIDYDPVVVGDVWRKARTESLNILPLVVDITRPSPATGWRNQECWAFLDRARDAFDAVLMLAVIHHMLVSERIALPEIVNLAAELTTDLLVIEFIAPDDSMFRILTRGRDDLFTGLTREHFESTCRRRFEIIRTQHLEHTSRWLYLLRKKGSSATA